MLRRLAIWALLVLPLITATATPSSAQSADRIAANLSDAGVFVESGSAVTEREVTDAVRTLADEGVYVMVAVLDDDPSDPDGLASTLRDKTDGTILLISPGFIAAASNDYESHEINSAIDDSFDSFDDLGDGIVAFGRALPASRSTPPTTSETATPTTSEDPDSTAGSSADSSGGSGIGGVLIFLGIIIGGVVALVLWTRSRNKKKVQAQITERRTAVSAELQEVGADIVELSDRVAFAEIDDATDHFRKGNDQFLELQNRLEAAQSLWEVTQIDYEADTAAWHLDATEALLDGKAVPDEPERPDLTTGRPADPAEVDRERSKAEERERVDSRLDDRYRRDQPRSRDRVESRRNRRGRWEAPKTRGGRLGDVGTGILVGGILRGGGHGRKPPPRWNGAGSLGSTRTGGSASRSRTRTRTSGSASRARKRNSRTGGSASRRR